MTAPQALILAIIVVAMALFLWGRWRHDLRRRRRADRERALRARACGCRLRGVRPSGRRHGGRRPDHQPRARLERGHRPGRPPRSAGRRRSLDDRADPVRAHRGVVVLHEQHRRARAADARRHRGRAARGALARAHPHAALVRLDPGGHDHAHRHAAEPDRRVVPGRGDGDALRHVRLRARGRGGRSGGRAVHRRREQVPGARSPPARRGRTSTSAPISPRPVCRRRRGPSG